MNHSTIGAQPVIIVGAGRSGTNMLRDILTSLSGVGTWPCDEINYIWRYGNKAVVTDELKPSHAKPQIIKYIRKQFSSMVARSDLATFPESKRVLIEKTCANSLRVDFVNTVVPEARYIHIVRDGRDVVASAANRWKAPLDIGYLMAKVRYVPKLDIPYYGIKYLINRIAKLLSKESTLSVWGPKFAGMSQLSKDNSLEYVCAVQWMRCVERANGVLEKMDTDKVFFLRYEDFVKNPIELLSKISKFLDLEVSEDEIVSACLSVRTESVGKGKTRKYQGSEDIEEMIKPVLRAFGYS